MFDVNEIVANAMSVMRTRVNTLASNIANAETTRTAEGGPYKRRDVVQVAQAVEGNFGSVLDEVSLSKPSVAAIVEDQTPPRQVYQPGHPDANPEGYVSYPNINIVESMTDLMSASKQYEANITVIKTFQNFARRAIDIISG